MAGESVLRVGVRVVALLAITIAVGLNLAAVATPSWQTMTLDTGSTAHMTSHLHGLWEDCVKNLMSDSEWLCSIRKYGQIYQCTSHQSFTQRDCEIHAGESWQQTTLILECIVLICGIGALLAISFSFCNKCAAACSVSGGTVAAAILTILATISAIAALSVFTMNAMDPNNAMIEMGTTMHEQYRGNSYYLACGAAGAFAIASIICGLAAAMNCCGYREYREVRRTDV